MITHMFVSLEIDFRTITIKSKFHSSNVRSCILFVLTSWDNFLITASEFVQRNFFYKKNVFISVHIYLDHLYFHMCMCCCIYKILRLLTLILQLKHSVLISKTLKRIKIWAIINKIDNIYETWKVSQIPHFY